MMINGIYSNPTPFFIDPSKEEAKGSLRSPEEYKGETSSEGKADGKDGRNRENSLRSFDKITKDAKERQFSTPKNEREILELVLTILKPEGPEGSKTQNEQQNALNRLLMIDPGALAGEVANLLIKIQNKFSEIAAERKNQSFAQSQMSTQIAHLQADEMRSAAKSAFTGAIIGGVLGLIGGTVGLGTGAYGMSKLRGLSGLEKLPDGSLTDASKLTFKTTNTDVNNFTSLGQSGRETLTAAGGTSKGVADNISQTQSASANETGAQRGIADALATQAAEASEKSGQLSTELAQLLVKILEALGKATNTAH